MFYLLKDKNLPCHIISCPHPPSTDPISSIDRKHLTAQSFHFVTVSDKSGYDSCYAIILSDAKPSLKTNALSGHTFMGNDDNSNAFSKLMYQIINIEDSLFCINIDCLVYCSSMQQQQQKNIPVIKLSLNFFL